jgi:hypothetical protein
MKDIYRNYGNPFKHHCEGFDNGLAHIGDLVQDEAGRAFIDTKSDHAFMCNYCPLCGARLNP